MRFTAELPLAEWLAVLDALDRDIQRALKLQNGDHIDRLGITDETHPAVCSRWP